LDALVRPFSDEDNRLGALRPDFIKLERFDPRKELAKLEHVDPANREAIAQLRAQVRELEASERPKFWSMEVPGSDEEIFDGFQLMYGRSGRCLSLYLAGDQRHRSALAVKLRNAFHGSAGSGVRPHIVTPFIQTTTAVAQDVLTTWKAGGSLWPQLWVQGGESAKETAHRDVSALAGVTDLITEQLRARVTGPRRSLIVSAAGENAVQALYTELQSLQGEIRLPGCYDFFTELLPRVAAALHVGWVDASGETEIGAVTWNTALSVCSWLAGHQHRWVTGCPGKQESGAAAPARRYPAPTPQDEVYFLRALSKIQPSTWRALVQRLPKRAPNYWQPIRDILIQNDHVALQGERLVLNRPL
jgi:hypothetical protein